MSLPKIVPCSCGHQPKLEETFSNIDGNFRRRYYVYCPKCGMEAPRKPNRTQAIKIWNYGQEGDSDAAENSRQA